LIYRYVGIRYRDKVSSEVGKGGGEDIKKEKEGNINYYFVANAALFYFYFSQIVIDEYILQTVIFWWG
jgi:hypothetical protein